MSKPRDLIISFCAAKFVTLMLLRHNYEVLSLQLAHQIICFLFARMVPLTFLNLFYIFTIKPFISPRFEKTQIFWKDDMKGNQATFIGLNKDSNSLKIKSCV